MSDDTKGPSGPDLTKGLDVARLRSEGRILGHVGDDNVLVVQVGEEVFAVSATCTHYKGPLGEGLVVGDTVRCPWHHACFSVRTGEAVRAPALDPVACWRVERDGDRLIVKSKIESAPVRRIANASAGVPGSVVIVGGGAAGLAAADMLRREGYGGPITMVSADAEKPYDRPNLSKDFLAGKAPEDWMPLREDDYYTQQHIDVRLNTLVTGIDTARRLVTLDRPGPPLSYGALLLATGAQPITLNVPGADSPHVHYLRSFADSRAIVAGLSAGVRAVVVGASFIGLEVAASLRARDIETHVVAPEGRPMEKVMGPDAGDYIRELHEAQGVIFHLDESVTSIDAHEVTLKSGASLKADVVIVGIGVRPVTDVAERAGIAADKGLTVNEFLETSAPGVFAAGDIARWPDPHTGERIRVEHWVVAERQGQVAARNILGRREPFEGVPFFWSQHYDTTINYVGHATRWDAIERDGDLDAGDCTLTFRLGGRTLAVATIGRDRESLLSELQMERQRVK